MKKWLTITVLGLSILGTIGSCTVAYINGTATSATASDATAKVMTDATAIKNAYNADSATASDATATEAAK